MLDAGTVAPLERAERRVKIIRVSDGCCRRTGGAGMKNISRVVAAFLVLPAAGVFLLGCPKKATKTELAPEPRVSESVVATRPGAGAAGDGRAAAPSTGAAAEPGAAEEQRLAQLL